jgi:hypothetical protein
MRTYWANVTNRQSTKLGPFEDREEAIDAILNIHPDCKEVTSGYGTEGVWFDIRFTRNPCYTPF